MAALAWWSLPLAALGVALLALPGLLGVTLGQLPWWAPDVSLALRVSPVVLAALVLARVGVAIRSTTAVAAEADR